MSAEELTALSDDAGLGDLALDDASVGEGGALADALV